MNPFDVLEQQSPALLSMQLLSLGVFMAAYAAAATRLLGPAGRLRAAGVAALAGSGFCLMFAPWTIGVLWLAGAVGTIGLFIAAIWSLSRALDLHDRAPALLESEDIGLDDDAAVPTSAMPRAAARAAPARFAGPTVPAPLG